MSKVAKAAKAEAEVLNELRPGQSVELLKELHILTREGRLNQDSRRKLKQVYHLFQFIEKLLRELPDDGAQATLADHGAGKSYLGFIIFDLFFRERGGGHVYGIETRRIWSSGRAIWPSAWVSTACRSSTSRWPNRPARRPCRRGSTW